MPILFFTVGHSRQETSSRYIDEELLCTKGCRNGLFLLLSQRLLASHQEKPDDSCRNRLHCRDVSGFGLRYRGRVSSTATAKHGIVVERRDKAKCPSKSKVEEATETIFSRIYRQEHHLFGYRIIFTGRLINCRVDKDLNLPPKYTEGCGQDGVMVITKYHFWKGTAVHEFGHAIRFRDGIDPDPEHGDCNYWYQVEHRRCAGW